MVNLKKWESNVYENSNENSKVYLEIGKKVCENKGNWEIKKIDKWQRKKSALKLERNSRNITKIEESRKMKKKKIVVCKTARRAHSQKVLE